MSNPDILKGDELPCNECEDGVLIEEGSPFENAVGEDDATYFRCNVCGALYNENGQLIRKEK